MQLDLNDTICAVASAPGGGVRGIVRVSGPETLAIVGRCVKPTAGDVFDTKRASCKAANIELPRGLGRVPLTLYLWPTASSYTRQPSAELHLPGSPPLIEATIGV